MSKARVSIQLCIYAAREPACNAAVRGLGRDRAAVKLRQSELDRAVGCGQAHTSIALRGRDGHIDGTVCGFGFDRARSERASDAATCRLRPLKAAGILDFDRPVGCLNSIISIGPGYGNAPIGAP